MALDHTAIASFRAGGPFQVSFAIGDKIKVQEQIKGWYKGIILSTGMKGIFPMSYVAAVHSSVNADPVLQEVSSTLYEWTGLLRSYYKDGKMPEFTNIKNRLTLLTDLYNSIKSSETDEVFPLSFSSLSLAIESERKDKKPDLLSFLHRL